MKENIYISEFGLINALGNDKDAIMKNVIAGSQTGMKVVTNLLLDDEITVASIDTKLPSLTDKPRHLNSRNNQLALMGIEQIRTEVEDLIINVGQDRIAIVVGTSTSGISQGEQAMAILQQQGQFPEDYDYRQQEIYNLAEFVDNILGG